MLARIHKIAKGRVLPWKISVWGGACAIRRMCRRRALDGDLCAARDCPARGGRSDLFLRVAVYQPRVAVGGCLPAGAGVLT